MNKTNKTNKTNQTNQSNQSENEYLPFSVLLENIILIEEILNENKLNEDKLKKDKLLENEKQSLLKELAKNYPAFEMYDNLGIWDNFLVTIFTWVKFLNDNYSQVFVDNILYKFKLLLENELNKDLNKEEKSIVIWDDYKNLVMKNNSIDEKELNEIIDALSGKLYEIYEEEFENFNKNLAQKNKKTKINSENFPLAFKTKKWKIKKIEWFWTESCIQYSIWKTRMDLEWETNKIERKEILNNSNNELDEKIGNINENNFKKYSKTNSEWVIEYSTEWGDYIEKFIVDQNIQSTNKIKIIDEKTWFYSKEIITKVRKNEIPEEFGLYKKVKKVINFLISNFEFIFPQWNCVGNIEDYKQIKNSIKNWTDLEKIDEYLNTYYKWFLPNYRFDKITNNKEGQMYFIDIKEMWSINIIWFFEEYEKVINWEISYEKAILNSWLKMTNVFKNLLKNIEKELEWKEFYITTGWDEIKLFIENDFDHKKTCEMIQTQLDEDWVECRITTRKKEKKENINELNDELDEKTEMSKEIEKFLQQIENRYIFKKEVIYIFLDEKWEYNLNFWENNFLLKEIFDKEWKIIPNSEFFQFIDEKWLWREK